MAVSVRADRLAEILRCDATRAAELLGTATELVERYAPTAPPNVANEAVIRTAGYLLEQPAAAQSWDQVGPLLSRFAPAHVSALRHSGAAALLTTYRRRRAV